MIVPTLHTSNLIQDQRILYYSIITNTHYDTRTSYYFYLLRMTRPNFIIGSQRHFV